MRGKVCCTPCARRSPSIFTQTHATNKKNAGRVRRRDFRFAQKSFGTYRMKKREKRKKKHEAEAYNDNVFTQNYTQAESDIREHNANVCHIYIYVGYTSYVRVLVCVVVVVALRVCIKRSKNNANT